MTLNKLPTHAKAIGRVLDVNSMYSTTHIVPSFIARLWVRQQGALKTVALNVVKIAKYCSTKGIAAFLPYTKDEWVSAAIL